MQTRLYSLNLVANHDASFKEYKERARNPSKKLFEEMCVDNIKMIFDGAIYLSSRTILQRRIRPWNNPVSISILVNPAFMEFYKSYAKILGLDLSRYDKYLIQAKTASGGSDLWAICHFGVEDGYSCVFGKDDLHLLYEKSAEVGFGPKSTSSSPQEISAEIATNAEIITPLYWGESKFTFIASAREKKVQDDA